MIKAIEVICDLSCHYIGESRSPPIPTSGPHPPCSLNTKGHETDNLKIRELVLSLKQGLLHLLDFLASRVKIFIWNWLIPDTNPVTWILIIWGEVRFQPSSIGHQQLTQKGDWSLPIGSCRMKNRISLTPASKSSALLPYNPILIERTSDRSSSIAQSYSHLPPKKKKATKPLRRLRSFSFLIVISFSFYSKSIGHSNSFNFLEVKAVISPDFISLLHKSCWRLLRSFGTSESSGSWLVEVTFCSVFVFCKWICLVSTSCFHLPLHLQGSKDIVLSNCLLCHQWSKNFKQRFHFPCSSTNVINSRSSWSWLLPYYSSSFSF